VTAFDDFALAARERSETDAEASEPRTSSGRPVRGHAASAVLTSTSADLKQHTRVARAAYLVCPVLGVTIRAVLLTRVDFSSSVVCSATMAQRRELVRAQAKSPAAACLLAADQRDGPSRENGVRRVVIQCGVDLQIQQTGVALVVRRVRGRTFA